MVNLQLQLERVDLQYYYHEGKYALCFVCFSLWGRNASVLSSPQGRLIVVIELH